MRAVVAVLLLVSAVHAAMWGVISGLVAATLTAVSYTMIKKLAQTESPTRIAVYFSVLLGIAVLPIALIDWHSISTPIFGFMVLSGILGGLGHIAMTEAFSRAPVTSLVACDYTTLLWTAVADFLIWGLLPTSMAVSGAALIVVAAAVVPFFSKSPMKRIVEKPRSAGAS